MHRFEPTAKLRSERCTLIDLAMTILGAQTDLSAAHRHFFYVTARDLHLPSQNPQNGRLSIAFGKALSSSLAAGEH
jgi:hypothetical protein